MRLRFREIFWAAALLSHALLSEGKGKDYYSTLGLKKNAKEDAIKKAYRCVPRGGFSAGWPLSGGESRRCEVVLGFLLALFETSSFMRPTLLSRDIIGKS